MKYLHFDNGDTFPQIGLGTYLSNPNKVADAVYRAIEIGYRHIDCAYFYKNEKEVGNGIQKTIKDGLVKREDLFITSKLWNNFHKKDEVEKAINLSLKELDLDYLDLYLVHWPLAFKKEMPESSDDLYSLDEVPLEETWEGMIDLKNKNLSKHIGVSNHNRPKIELLTKATGVTPEVNQIEIHPYFQQKDLKRYCERNNILVTAYSPLGSRHLVNTEKSIIEYPLIKEIADKHNCTPAQVILAWGIQRGTAVIPKSDNPERIEENYRAIDIELQKEDMLEISTIDKNIKNSKGDFAIFEDGPYTLKNLWEE